MWATRVLLGICHVPITSGEGPTVPQFWGFHYVDTLCCKTGMEDGRPQEAPPPGSALPICVCSGSAVLRDLGVNRSVKRYFLSILLIYCRISLTVFIV